jgi:uncharacterized protein with HEPN domain
MERKLSAKDQNAHFCDMMKSAQAIARYMAGVTFEQFRDNREKRDAVAMRIAAIGDAAQHVTKAAEWEVPGISFQNFRKMRDRIAPGYGKVDVREVWTVAERDITPLLEVLEGHFVKQGMSVAAIEEED